MAIKTFRRKLTRVNSTYYVSVPKYLVESENLNLGQVYDFIIKIPDKKEKHHGA